MFTKNYSNYTPEVLVLNTSKILSKITTLYYFSISQTNKDIKELINQEILKSIFACFGIFNYPLEKIKNLCDITHSSTTNGYLNIKCLTIESLIQNFKAVVYSRIE